MTAISGAHVTRLRLGQFRSYPRADLALDGRPVALWGGNGAGKTNVLEAVSLLSPGRGLRRAAAEEMARRPAAVAAWRIRAEVRTGGPPREIETGAEAGASRYVRLDGKAVPHLALAELLRIVWLVPAQDRLWIEGAEGRRRFLDRIAMSLAPAHGAAVLAYEKAMRERNRLLKDQVQDPGWYDALEGQMGEAAARIIACRAEALGAIQTAQDTADTAFPTAELSLDDGDLPPAAADLAVSWAKGRRADLAAGRTLIGPHRTDLTAVYAAKGQPARLCSTGEQKALLISLVLANARALLAREGAPPLVLLDEVAAHLDADRRAALFDEICALGAQAWMTGTGPELFAELGPRAQGFHVTEDQAASHIAPAEIMAP